MFGWICVVVAAAVMALKGVTAWVRKDQKFLASQAKPEIRNNLTRPVRESRMMRMAKSHIYSAGFYGFNLPQELGQQLHWTGRGGFSKAHRIEDIPHPRLTYTCTPDILKQRGNGGCFVKDGEGYSINSFVHRSSPLTCPHNKLCTITATFHFSNTIPFNDLSPENVLEITKPSNVLRLAYLTNTTTLNISQTFRGPGTQVILVKPIFWLVMGMYRPTAPLGQHELNQTYATARFLMLTNGQIDAIYTLYDANQTIFK